MVLTGFAALTFALPALATWSIVMVNTRTKEVAIGSSTCLTMFDLQKGASVVVPGLGVGAAQSAVDTSGENRLTIRLGLRGGEDPADILIDLENQDPAFQSRQYGIVDTQGRAVTFTGDQDGAWAGGVIGQVGEIVYAIQGNVLTGEPVVLLAEQAVIDTPGSMAEKLMAGMEAARSMGGDGRCSCSPRDPTGCGSPPPEFTKSAHIGYMIASRIGDFIGPCDRQNGCAAGDYYMDFNFAFKNNQDPDPVILLREAFEQWKLDMIGIPDAVESLVSWDKNSIPADGQSKATLIITLLDLNGDPITVPVNSLTITDSEETKRLTIIGDPVDLGNGQYSVEVTSRRIEGIAKFDVTVDDGNRPVILMPQPEIEITRPTTGLVLGDPSPGMVGQDNQLCITGGTPGETISFIAGFDLGPHGTACGPIMLKVPHLAGQATVDVDGNACVSGFVPSNMSGKTIFFQAVQGSDCQRSNVVTWIIP